MRLGEQAAHRSGLPARRAPLIARFRLPQPKRIRTLARLKKAARPVARSAATHYHEAGASPAGLGLEKNRMLESIRKGQRWLTLLLVAFVGAVFVFFMGVGGQFGPSSPSGKSIVQISGTQMSEGDFNRLRARLEQFYRDEMGEQFDGREQADALNALALRELVNQVVLAHSARELGIRVDREEIQQLVTQSPEFRDDTGRFNKDAFVEYAKWEYGSQRAFIERMRTDLLRQKMIGLLYDQASVSPSEARDAALYGLEQRRLAYVTLDPTQLPPGDPQAEIDDETLTAWVQANDESLQSAYQENSAQYAEPAEATAR
ncbi:MAG: hypothetical protein CBC48_22210, partial [bacterium TMED88]